MSCYYDLKCMFPSMEILNYDGLSQFYFGGLLVLVHKFGNDDNTILYYARVSTSRWESRTSTNSVVLMMCKRKNELSDKNSGAQTGVNLQSRHLFFVKYI